MHEEQNGQRGACRRPALRVDEEATVGGHGLLVKLDDSLGAAEQGGARVVLVGTCSVQRRDQVLKVARERVLGRRAVDNVCDRRVVQQRGAVARGHGGPDAQRLRNPRHLVGGGRVLVQGPRTLRVLGGQRGPLRPLRLQLRTSRSPGRRCLVATAQLHLQPISRHGKTFEDVSHGRPTHRVANEDKVEKVNELRVVVDHVTLRLRHKLKLSVSHPREKGTPVSVVEEELASQQFKQGAANGPHVRRQRRTVLPPAVVRVLRFRPCDGHKHLGCPNVLSPAILGGVRVVGRRKDHRLAKVAKAHLKVWLVPLHLDERLLGCAHLVRVHKEVVTLQVKVHNTLRVQRSKGLAHLQVHVAVEHQAITQRCVLPHPPLLHRARVPLHRHPVVLIVHAVVKQPAQTWIVTKSFKHENLRESVVQYTPVVHRLGHRHQLDRHVRHANLLHGPRRRWQGSTKVHDAKGARSDAGEVNVHGRVEQLNRRQLGNLKGRRAQLERTLDQVRHDGRVLGLVHMLVQDKGHVQLLVHHRVLVSISIVQHTGPCTQQRQNQLDHQNVHVAIVVQLADRPRSEVRLVRGGRHHPPFRIRHA
mmetsp:Transcript_2861/g.9305  ORF Transcript_2861/g.9305 Transcript_2861/m.9305 type:complete len:588 (-) Transcript_2861:260-2023(-)